MTSNVIYTPNIFEILQSKPHNPHYLRRYYNFINACSKINSTKSKEELDYTEKHHICPKSLFKEFKNFRIHQWNCSVLTFRQHFISHWLLYKSYGRVQALGFDLLCKQHYLKVLLEVKFLKKLKKMR